jgi:Protein of unknown function (DUF742)
MSDAWIDDAAGPLVRSFALTGGRGRPKDDTLQLLTYVVATDKAATLRRVLHPEQLAIIDCARTPASVAEIASYVDLPVGVVRVLLSDLAERGAITTIESHPVPDDDLLKAVIHGLQSL